MLGTQQGGQSLEMSGERGRYGARWGAHRPGGHCGDFEFEWVPGPE